MQVNIADIELSSHVILAPMSGVTDLPYRKLVKKFGAGLVVSEMVASRAMIALSHQSLKKSAIDKENDDATTAQVGRGSRRFSGMFWKASWGFKQCLRRHLRFWKFWKLSENCPITFQEDSENQIQQLCTASSLQDLYRQDDWGRRSSRSELNPPAPRLRAAKYWIKTA